jgi:glycine/D-amino acid oxidase-like deaminating enzyme
VGLGGSGLAAVDELRRRGLSVVGLDAGRIAAGAAGRNGGFLLGGSAEFLHKAARTMGSDAAVALYRHTQAELDHLAEVLGPGVVRRVGSIRLAGLPGPPADVDDAADDAADEPADELADAADVARELADCAEHEAVLRRHGIAVERYDGPLGQGLFLPEDAATNPARRCLELATQLAPGAQLYENSPVLAVSQRHVVTRSGSVSAGVVVVAVDGGLETLLPELAGRVRTARLQMLCTEPVPARLPCPVYGRWGYDYAQQDEHGRLFVGGGRDRFAAQEWTTAAEPTAPVQSYIEQVARRMAGGPIRVTHRWAASVGYTPEGRPLVTEIETGVVACGGYNGTGNLVGPVAARVAVALALDGQPPPSYFSS